MNSDLMQNHPLQGFTLAGGHLIEVLSEPAWISNASHALLSCNGPFRDMFGPDQVSLQDMMPPEQHPLLPLNGGQPVSFAARLGQQFGQLFLLPLQAGDPGWMGFFRAEGQASKRLKKAFELMSASQDRGQMLDCMLQVFPLAKGCVLFGSEDVVIIAGEVNGPVQKPDLQTSGQDVVQVFPLTAGETLVCCPLPDGVLGLVCPVPAAWSDTEKLLLHSVGCLLTQNLERLKWRDDQETTIARLQAILDNAPVGIGLRNTDLKIELVNRKAAEYNQHPETAHQNRSMNELFPGAFEKVENYMKQVLDSGIPILDLELTDQDLPGFRKGHHWQLNYFPVKSTDGRTLGVGSIIQDITRRKISELALRESQHFLQRMADTVPTLIYIYDIGQRKNIYFNRELQNILGYTPEEMQNLDQSSASAMIHPDELQVTVQHYQKLWTLQMGEVLTREYRMRHKNGSWRWLFTREAIFSRDEQGNPTQFLGGAIDITEWKEAQQTIQESESRFQVVADRAPVMIWMADPEGNAVFHNLGWTQFTGRPPEEDLGSGWLDLMHPEDRKILMDTFLAPERLHQPFETEYRLKRHDGQYRWVVDRGAPRFTPEGKFVGFIGACIDIHDRKMAETVLQDSEQKLRELSESQKRFVADAAHELRTPLTSIQGNLDLFVRFPDIPETDRKEILRDVQREATRLGRLVHDMLQLARGDSGAQMREDEVDVSGVVQEAFRDLERVRKSHRMVLGEIQEVLLLGDADRLKQLTLILLENALKYTPAGGEVGLKLTLQDQEAELKVWDTGVGISEEDAVRVFERFYRVDRARQRGEDPGGTGLGLPIAKWIAEGHGGKIWLESELGKGTTAIVRLPVRVE
ncbi:PAS domain S-box protein [Deinococcus roseus]|uniref:histidine kinase n=1 Tax=Deinococcus roseus TaxID=392414 RepID=A0ABQ2CX07_9DEIO|nr:PAS domain S-box protein [Deinococcus roseus]GGJ29183.1 hypothetical protein GCM10008938_14130 [Deinococcus roseus]